MSITAAPSASRPAAICSSPSACLRMLAGSANSLLDTCSGSSVLEPQLTAYRTNTYTSTYSDADCTLYHPGHTGRSIANAHAQQDWSCPCAMCLVRIRMEGCTSIMTCITTVHRNQESRVYLAQLALIHELALGRCCWSCGVGRLGGREGSWGEGALPGCPATHTYLGGRGRRACVSMPLYGFRSSSSRYHTTQQPNFEYGTQYVQPAINPTLQRASSPQVRQQPRCT